MRTSLLLPIVSCLTVGCGDYRPPERTTPRTSTATQKQSAIPSATTASGNPSTNPKSVVNGETIVAIGNDRFPQVGVVVLLAPITRDVRAALEKSAAHDRAFEDVLKNKYPRARDWKRQRSQASDTSDEVRQQEEQYNRERLGRLLQGDPIKDSLAAAAMSAIKKGAMRVTTDSKGRFEIELQPGKYAIVTESRLFRGDAIVWCDVARFSPGETAFRFDEEAALVAFAFAFPNPTVHDFAIVERLVSELDKVDKED